MVRGACAVLAVVAVAVAQPPGPAPGDVIRKAIDAHGGLAVLKKHPAGTSKFAGKIMAQDTPLAFTGAIAFAVPGRAKLEMTIEGFGQKTTFVQIVNGDKVTQLEAGKASKLTPAIEAEVKDLAVTQELSLLYPLLDAGKYTLTAEPPVAVDGQPASGVLVRAKGAKDARLYFDQKTGLLTALRRDGLNPERKKVDELTVFSDYRPANGMMVPMRSRVTHDGKPFMDLSVTEYRPLETIDEKTFAAD